MQSKNKNSKLLKSPKPFESCLFFVLPLIPACPSSFVWVSLRTLKCIDVVGRQVVDRKTTTSSLQLEPCSRAGWLHLDKLGLEILGGSVVLYNSS